MSTVGDFEYYTVCDTGSICGDDPQCEIVFPLVIFRDPAA